MGKRITSHPRFFIRIKSCLVYFVNWIWRTFPVWNQLVRFTPF